MRTLMNSAWSDRPQRRKALVGRELWRYGIQIAALSETRFAAVGEIKEVGTFIFFRSGRKSEERREKVQVGKDQEKAQSEKDSHSKNRGGKKLN